MPEKGCYWCFEYWCPKSDVIGVLSIGVRISDVIGVLNIDARKSDVIDILNIGARKVMLLVF